jgi:hypothetical protein
VSLSRRGKIVLTVVVTAALLSAAVGAMALTGHAPAPIKRVLGIGTTAAPPPPTCPLTGTRPPGGAIPKRPALAIKVENLPAARPQAGLDRADIVYEEPVEGGITRFIAVFQCRTASRVGPVRSGRTTDPDVLRQLGHPLLAYAGGANKVVNAIDHSPLIDMSYTKFPGAFVRDPNRPAPHNLYTSPDKLWTLGKKASKTWKAPSPIFRYGRLPARAGKASYVHIDFSIYSDVYWRWSATDDAWLRFHGTVPHTLDDGSQVRAKNVVVMQVKVTTSSIVDVAGNPSPEVNVVGSGKAWVFRDGHVQIGTWKRAALSDVTTYKTKGGKTIQLSRGNTWVELVPTTIRVQIGR